VSYDLSAIASALRGVPGVAAASVEPDASGGVDCLRLGLSDGADPRAVAQAASQLVHERFGTVLHRDQVLIVEDAPPAPEPASAVPPQRAGRPEIVRTDLVTSGRDFNATVILSARSRAVTGYAKGATTAPGMQRAVAQATLKAVERLVGDSARLELDYVDVSQSGQDRTVLVSLTFISERGAERLSGSAIVREDENGAVVRATLDGVNRRIETMLG
jgi:hypothetical protein